VSGETGGGLTAEEREALSNAIGAKVYEQFDEGEKIDIDWAIIYAADAAEAFFAARVADRDAALARVEALARDLCAWDLVDMPVPDSVDVPDDYELGMNDAGAALHAALHPAPSEAP
jgi:hypothetical protein